MRLAFNFENRPIFQSVRYAYQNISKAFINLGKRTLQRQQKPHQNYRAVIQFTLYSLFFKTFPSLLLSVLTSLCTVTTHFLLFPSSICFFSSFHLFLSFSKSEPSRAPTASVSEARRFFSKIASLRAK